MVVYHLHFMQLHASNCMKWRANGCCSHCYPGPWRHNSCNCPKLNLVWIASAAVLVLVGGVVTWHVEVVMVLV